MKLKINKYLLLVVLFLNIISLHARVPTLEKIAANEEYRLKVEYNKKHVYL